MNKPEKRESTTSVLSVGTPSDLQSLRERRTALNGILIRSSNGKRIEAEAVTWMPLKRSLEVSERTTNAEKNFDQLYLKWTELKALNERVEQANADLMKIVSKNSNDVVVLTTASNEFQQRLTQLLQSTLNELNESKKQLDFELMKRSAQLDSKIKEIADANATVETTLISAGDRVFEKVNAATAAFADTVSQGAKSVAATTKASEALIQTAGRDAAGAIRRAMNGTGFRVTLIALLVLFVGLSAWNTWTQAQILDQAKSASTGVFQIWKVQGIGPKYEAMKQAEADAAAAAKETK